MRELVVISGKGGTGKTSIAASLAVLAAGQGHVVLADCDVDAANLHLVLEPAVRERNEFVGGAQATVDPARCAACGQCVEACRPGAMSITGPGNDVVARTARVDPIACEGCGVCDLVCPCGAVDLRPVVNGQWFVSETRAGPMLHARLGVAEENSGKLVTLLRRRARQVAVDVSAGLLLVDGSPGIGCPVIASMTAADAVLVVAEPTASGLSDLARVLELADRLDVPALLCVNKADIHPATALRIERLGAAHGARMVGRIPYDPAVTAAQLAGRTIVEYGDSPAARAIRSLWRNVTTALPPGRGVAPSGLPTGGTASHAHG